MMPPPVLFAGRLLGVGHRPLIVAELSGNHRGELSRALALIDVAKAAGADAVKLQTYTAETITLECDRPWFHITDGPWKGRQLADLYREAATPWAWHEALFARCRALGLPAFSTPFDASAVDFLGRFDPPAYKIASFELVDLPLIRRVAATGRPLILSTGMATPTEIDDAVTAARDAGCRELVVLHCVSAYPADPGDARLSAMPALAARAGAPAGLSDHSLGTAVAVAAVALGAVMIEKHLTLARADGGPDAGFSMEPHEFAALVRDCHDVWKATHTLDGTRPAAEAACRRLRRSLFVVRDVAAGEVFTPDAIRSIRPADGLPPKHLDAVLGRRASKRIERGTPLSWELVADCPPSDSRSSDRRRHYRVSRA